jgi:hypothetical protein
MSLQRRAFLLGWFPFFHKRHRELCGVSFHVMHYGRSPAATWSFTVMKTPLAMS